jgi:hypothetical protein
MGHRFPYFLLLLLLAVIAFIIIAARPLICNDPLGCTAIRPGEDITIGVGVMTSGSDRPVSLEMLHGAQLAVKNSPAVDGHKLTILPFYSTCLPGEPAQASIDLAASNPVTIILGPSCSENYDDFFQRASRSGKTVISPVPSAFASPAETLSFSPDQASLVKQTARQILSLGYAKLAVIPNMDPASQDFSAALCSDLSALKIECIATDSGANPAGQIDAAIAISMDENTGLSADVLQEWQDFPQIYVSLTLPQVNPKYSHPAYWIGPLAWENIRKFVSLYQAAYQTPPVSLAAWVSYDSLSLIGRSLQRTAVVQWDGSWIIPRSGLRNQVQLDGKDTGLFKYACNLSTPGCQEFPLALYQFSGNDYRLVKP